MTFGSMVCQRKFDGWKRWRLDVWVGCSLNLRWIKSTKPRVITSYLRCIFGELPKNTLLVLHPVAHNNLALPKYRRAGLRCLVSFASALSHSLVC
jgi:hypothetical protein